MKVFWKDAEKTILIRESPETMEWKDYEAGIQKMYEMLREVKHDVFIIIDATRVVTVPKGSLSYFSKANTNLPLHVVMRILTTKNTLLYNLTLTLQKVVPDKFENFHFANTMEEAYEKIAAEKRKRQEA